MPRAGDGQKHSNTRGKTPPRGNATSVGPTRKAGPATTPDRTDRAARRAQVVQERRSERIHRTEREARQRQLMRIGTGVLGALLVVAIGFFAWDRYQQYQGNQVLDEVVDYEYAGGQHLDGELTYTESPPVGGQHNNVWQNCGYYAAPVPNWHAVHSLEHGAVWITYQPELPDDQVSELRELAEDMDYILVSPYPGLSAPVVASSWNHQLSLQSATDPGLDAFIREYRQGPDTPERGALCSQGNAGTLT